MTDESEVPDPPEDAEASEEGEPPEHLAGQEVHTALIERETQPPTAVQYVVVDGLAIFEGDIILGPHEALQQRTAELRAEMAARARGIGAEATPGDSVDPAGLALEAVVVTGQSRRWPGGVIPFDVAGTLPATQSTAVTNAIAHWHANTRLLFRARTAADDQWVHFQPGSGCNSDVGRQGTGLFTPAPQVINLASGCLFGQAVHEIGHAVGLWHEQSREDRNTFVSILWANIQSGQSHNFDQQISDGDDIGPYDYGSIMHYGATAFGTTAADGSTNTTIVALQPIPAGVTMGQRSGLSVLDRAAVAWMYGGVYPGSQNTWVGRFRGAGDELLYYAPAPRKWYLSQVGGATMSFAEVSDTTGFGDLADGRPIWAGDFTGGGQTDVLFYYPGDDNWWLGTLSGGGLNWSLVGNTAGFGHGINDGRPFWIGDFDGDGAAEVLFYYPGDDNWWLGSVDNAPGENPQCAPLRSEIARLRNEINQLTRAKAALNPRDPEDRAEIRRLDAQISAKRAQVTQREGTMASLGCPATPSAGGPQLGWSLVGNTAGFGHAINDGRPFWTGDFTGNGSTDVLFYYPGDDNWWLGEMINGQLTWSFAGNTAGFGHGISDGRPFWVGDFNGDGSADVLFYYPGDDNWWLGSLKNVPGEDAQCATLRAEIAGLQRDITDLNQAKAGLNPRDPIDRAEIREINLQITAKRQEITQRQGQMATLACPATPSPGGRQLAWSLVGNTAGFGHGINDGRPFWIGDFSGSGGLDVLFNYRGDLNWWRGSVAGGALGWTLAATW